MLRGCVGLVESRLLRRTTHELRHLLYVMGLSWLDRDDDTTCDGCL
jgi:hypothetical protein